MKDFKYVEGNLTVKNKKKVAVISSRFNHFIVDKLEQGCLDTFSRQGEGNLDITVYKVPGAFELPLMAKWLAETKRFDGVVVLGAVIRGATAHFEIVSNNCATGVSRVSLDYGLPVIFGVITVDTIEQAIERAGTKAGNKGSEAAATLLEMLSLSECL